MTRLLLLLGLLAAGLAAVIVLELEDFATPEVPVLAAAQRPSPASPATAAERNQDDWIAQSLARPLFNPDRRPAPAGTAGASGNRAEEPPRLTGILITSAGRQAIFAVGERSLAVREGGGIGSFVVREISGGQVSLTGPAGPRLVRPSYIPVGEDKDRAAAGRPAAGTAAAFAANPAPSGLDILRNAARQAADAAPPASPDSPEAGVDATARGFAPPAFRPALPGRAGAFPSR